MVADSLGFYVLGFFIFCGHRAVHSQRYRVEKPCTFCNSLASSDLSAVPGGQGEGNGERHPQSPCQEIDSHRLGVCGQWAACLASVLDTCGLFPLGYPTNNKPDNLQSNPDAHTVSLNDSNSFTYIASVSAAGIPRQNREESINLERIAVVSGLSGSDARQLKDIVD